jgi:hypothetical protein
VGRLNSNGQQVVINPGVNVYVYWDYLYGYWYVISYVAW